MAESMAFTKRPAGLVPAARFHNAFGAKFVDGATYWVTVEAERTEKSHNHEFAWLNEAWKTLPDHLAEQYPSAEHLRKRALIQAGFYDEQIIDAGTKAAAVRVAAGVRARPGESFSMVFVRDCFVIIRTAKSQSRRAMKAEEFQRSKTAILEVVSELLGVRPEQLTRARAA